MRAWLLVAVVLLAGCAQSPDPAGPANVQTPAPAVDLRNATFTWNSTGDLAFALEVSGTGACRIDWAAAGPSEGLPAGLAYLHYAVVPGEEPDISFGHNDGNGNHGADPEFAVHAGPQTIEQRKGAEPLAWAARRAFDVAVTPEAGNATLVLMATATGPHDPVELTSQHVDEPAILLNATARLATRCDPTVHVRMREASLALFDSSRMDGGFGVYAGALFDLATVSAQNRIAFTAGGDGIATAFIGIDPEKHGRLTLDAPDQDFEWVFVPTHFLDVVPTPGYVGTRQGPGDYKFTLDMVGGPVFGLIEGAFADIGARLDPASLPGGPAVVA